MTFLLGGLTWIFNYVRKRPWILYIVAGLVLLLLLVFTFRSCGKKSAKVDLDTVDRINDGNKVVVHNEVIKIVEDNAVVTTTVDNRTTIAETNVVERDRLFDEKVRIVERKIAETKANGENVTQEGLQCALVPSDCQ